DADVADALRVVLELVCVRLVPLELARHEGVVEAAEGNAGVVPRLERLRTVDPADRRPEALRVVRRAQLGRRLHGDAGLGALDAGDPRRRPGDLAVLDLLGVLSEVPDVAVIVLSKERQFAL